MKDPELWNEAGSPLKMVVSNSPRVAAPRKLTFVESRSTDEGRRDDSLQQQAREVVNLTKKGESQATNASAVEEASLIEGVVVGVEVTAIQDNGEKAQEDKVCMEVDVTENIREGMVPISMVKDGMSSNSLHETNGLSSNHVEYVGTPGKKEDHF
jgi:hypothetical protein